MSDRDAIISHRRGKAREALFDACLLAGNGRYVSAVNRVYYALFHQVSALLLTRELTAARHSGVRFLFNEHFVKPGLVTIEDGTFFSSMGEFRHKSDYADFVEFDSGKVGTWMEKAEGFLNRLDLLFG